MEKFPAPILEALQAAFPAELKGDVTVAIETFAGEVSDLPLGPDRAINVIKSQIKIPYRIYFPEPSSKSVLELAKTQRAIVTCPMTRHHSGYVREAWAARLSDCPEAWTVPFAAVLLEDYVFEVAWQTESMLTPPWIALFRDFAAANPDFKRQLGPRIVTNWNDDYRGKFPTFLDYPIYKTAKLLDLWDPETAPRLTRTHRAVL